MEEFTTSNKAEDCDKGTGDSEDRESRSHYFNPIFLCWSNGFRAGWSDRVVVVDVDLLTAAEVEIADICLAAGWKGQCPGWQCPGRGDTAEDDFITI